MARGKIGMVGCLMTVTTKAQAGHIGLEEIEAAREVLKGQVVRTPTIAAPKLSGLTGAEVYVKCESLQFTGSFKDRGALVKLASLSDSEARRGVIAMSAGNHAQAVAYHAKRLGIPATIVMPEHTPFVKVANTEAFGAEVVLSGRGLYEAQARAVEIAEERGLVIVHPYDDPRIIAGQGTIAVEVLADIPDLDMIVVPIGGGGLIAGNAIAAHAIKPDLAVIGVCSAACPSMHAALTGQEVVCSEQTLADGIAVKAPGKLTLPIVKEHVSRIVLVEEPAIERAICALLGLQKIIAEGAGAASLAALLTEPERFRGRKLCLYLTGGNIDPRMLASVVVRGLEREGKIVSLRLTITDQPGVLGRVATILGASGANILEVFHRRTMLDVPARGATLDL
ncbi:MAG TPA: threonine ammonia-lyase, partial [Methyloceanibacter sp.]|nr:threonine ammonia-lyase [Methyloceanibacter sp.]